LTFGIASLAVLGAVVALGCTGLEEANPGQSTGAGSGGDGGGGGNFGGSENGGGPSTSSSPEVPDDTRAGGDGKQDPIDLSEGAGGDPVDCGGDHPTTPFFLSADDSNSMASPVLAREWLNAGLAPDPTQIRTYEFLNYYNAVYPLPDAAAGLLGVHANLQDLSASTTTGGRQYRLQIGVQAFEVPRVPLVVTFVVDTSGSLVGPGIERAREVLVAVADQLEAGDIVNVATWANEDSVVLEGYVASGDASDGGALAKVVANLLPGGGSNLHGGLVQGYKLASDHFDAAKLNRVVLISDGGANLVVLDRNVIADAASDANTAGIYLVGIGVGPAKGYSDNLMNLVTDAGRGAYVYLDDPAEAHDVFTTRWDEVMNVAAHDVKIELDLPPYLEIKDFYAEKYSPVESEIEPQNLAPGDSMILNQTLYATSAVSVCNDDILTVKVSWQTPLTHEDRSSPPLTMTLSQLLGQELSPQMVKANAIIAYAEALKTGDPVALGSALTEVEAAFASTQDEDLQAIAALLALHPSLAK